MINFGERPGCFTRIAQWNTMRYPDLVLNVPLTTKLLKEEVEEFDEAISVVDTLDALVDIIYVAIGAMHKLGLNPQQMYEALHIVCDSNDSKSIQPVASHLKANVDKGPDFIAPEVALIELLERVHHNIHY